MPQAAEAQDDSANVSGSLQAPKWLIGTIVMALIGATGAGSYATYRTSDAPTVEQAEAIAARQAKGVAAEVLSTHQKWLDERLSGIERQIEAESKTADKRADQQDRRMDVLEGEVRQLRDRLLDDLASRRRGK